MINIEELDVVKELSEIRSSTKYEKHEVPSPSNTPKYMKTYPLKCKYVVFTIMNRNEPSHNLSVNRSIRNCKSFTKASVDKDGVVRNQKNT